MKLNCPLWVHTTLQIVPPLALLILLLIIRLLVFLASFLREEHFLRKPTDFLTKTIPKILFGPPRGVIGFTPADQNPTLYIGNKRLKNLAWTRLTLAGLFFIGNVAAMFWSFLLNETYSCNTRNYDCFVLNENDSLPVSNCSLYKGTDVEFICFAPTFSMSRAVAAAGGLFTALRYMTLIVSRAALWIQNKLHRVNEHTYHHFVFGVVVGFTQVGYMSIWILLVHHLASKLGSFRWLLLTLARMVGVNNHWIVIELMGFLKDYNYLGRLKIAEAIQIVALFTTMLYLLNIPWHRLTDKNHANQSEPIKIDKQVQTLDKKPEQPQGVPKEQAPENLVVDPSNKADTPAKNVLTRRSVH